MDRNPILKKDGTYCSPSCGLKCTKEAYDKAVSNADILAARMGTGWEPRLREKIAELEKKNRDLTQQCYHQIEHIKKLQLAVELPTIIRTMPREKE